LAEIEGEKYVVDNVACPGLTLACPIKIVEDAFNKNIIQKLAGKTLTDEQMQIILNKLSSDQKKSDSRLGCASSSEIQKAQTEKNYWEVLFSLHQLIEYRLRKLLFYKSSEVDRTNSLIITDASKRKICKEVRTFKHLIDIGYLAGAINHDERTKALVFNAERDNIAHELLLGEVTDSLLETASTHGIELLNLLEAAFQRIVPRPKMIIMDSLVVPDFML
jgi:hypothetical protein